MVHLYQSLKNTIKFGYQSRIIEDSLGNSASNFGLIYKSILLGNILKRTLERESEEPVGLMLPNIVPTAIVFFALQYLSKVTAIINFTSGSKNIISCLKKSNIKYLITSKKFIDQGNLISLVEDIENKNYQFIYLEDIKITLSLKDKLCAVKDFLINIFLEKKLNNWMINQNDFLINHKMPLIKPSRQAVTLDYKTARNNIPDELVGILKEGDYLKFHY